VVGYYKTPYRAGKVYCYGDYVFIEDESAIMSFTYSNSTTECADVNHDGLVNLLDIIFLINYVYLLGPAPHPPIIGDLDNDGYIIIFDITALISYLYFDGPEPTCGLE
jgi:hypothetical protein